METKKYIIKQTNKFCYIHNYPLQHITNKLTKSKYYNCDKCDGFFDIGEIDNPTIKKSITQ